MGTVAFLLWLLLLAVHLVTGVLAWCHPALRRRAARRADMPPVTMLLPVHGLVDGFETCLASAFAAGNSDVELLICAQHAEPTVMEAIARVAAAHPGRPFRIVRGQDHFTASPKIDNIAEAYREARHDVLVIKDDTICLRPGQLPLLVSELTDETGMVVAVPLVEDAQGLAPHVEQAYINAHNGRWLMAGATLGLGFGIGKLCAFRRSDLDRAGGLEAIAHTIAEDNAMTKILRASGLPTHMAETTADQRLGQRRFRQVWDRLVRWVVCRRIEEPMALVGEFVSSFAVAAILAILAAIGLDLSVTLLLVVTFVVWTAGDLFYAVTNRQRISVLTIPAGLLRDCLFPFVLLAGICSRNVEWGGKARRATLSKARMSGSEPE